MITPTDDLCVSRDDLKYAFLILLYCAYAFPRDDFCVTRDDFVICDYEFLLWVPSVLSLRSINKQVFPIVYIAACKHDFIVMFTYYLYSSYGAITIASRILSFHLMYVVYFCIF